jgi:UDP-3-O-[3-hydroxymyristoyl] glucosamine N-acyltransferase
MKQFKLSELVSGLDITIQGDPECVVSGVSTIQQAQSGQITFLVNPLYKKYLPTTQASAVILSTNDAKECPVNALIARDPYFAYAKIATRFDFRPQPMPGIHPSAVVGKNGKIDPTASIGPNCVISDHVTIAANTVILAGCYIGEGVEIGENTRLDANVTIYHRVIIKNRVIISSGTVIGSDGFGIAKHQGVWHKVPQLGSVIIEDDVEIGSNCSIDRGAIDNTVIEKGVKLDNLIQIGHNVRIGEHTAMAGCVGVAGSTTIGKNCLVGGSAGFSGHLTIADNVVITGDTAVTKSIREPGIYSSGVGGLVTNLEWKKTSARVHRLEQLMDRVKELELILGAEKKHDGN